MDVYDLLDFKKDAYDLLSRIGNRSDRKVLKRLGTLKEYAESWGNHYAVPKPKTPEEKQKEKERRTRLGLPPSAITRILWIPGLLRSLGRALSVTAAENHPSLLYGSFLFSGGY